MYVYLKFYFLSFLQRNQLHCRHKNLFNVDFFKTKFRSESFQMKPLYNNVLAGIIVANQSLVLQNVTRARSGSYTCIGINNEGDGESNTMLLDIKCKHMNNNYYAVNEYA